MLPRFIIFLILIVFFLGSASFGLTLRESVEIALENGPEILAQTEKIKGAEGQVGQAFSGYLPSLKIEGEVGKDYRTPISYDLSVISPGAFFTLYPDEAANVTNYRAVLSQNLYMGGKLSSQLDIAKVGLEITKDELKRKKQELTYQVASAYYGVLHAQRLLELSLESKEFAQAHLDLVKNYFSLGRVPKADMLRAKVKVSGEDLRKIQAENQLDLVKIEFNNVLGREIEKEVLLEDMKFKASKKSLPSYKELLALAFEHRAERRVMSLQKRIGEKEISLAKSGYFPNLVLSGSTAKNITDYPDNSIRRDVDSWNVYGMLSWTVFDGLYTPNQIKVAQAGLAEVEVREKQVMNRITADVKASHLTFKAAELSIQAAQEEVEYAEENLKHAQEKYRKGVSGNIDLLEAQTSLSKAKTDLLFAESDLELAKARVNLAVGDEVFALY